MIGRSTAHALVWAYRHATGKLVVPEHTLLAQLLPSDSICFDVGAHGGSWSRGLARLVPQGRVYSFEALPYYARVLRMTMRLLRVRQVTVLNRAVGEADGTVEMVRQNAAGELLTGKTHVATPVEQARQKISVPVTTLDGFWREIGEKPVTFVKCDVEGFEIYVLRGAKNLIQSCRPYFFNELNEEWCSRYGYAPGDIFAFFGELSYLPFYLDSDKGAILCNADKHVNGDILFAPAEQRAAVEALKPSTRKKSGSVGGG